MSSQIDPVTGLPVFAPPPLEEPPFLNPPFPWKDLTGIDVPPRTTYYGSDGIPTISTVAGMNPQDNRGQTVNTDGNHALLVSNVGGSGGGGGLAPVAPLDHRQTEFEGTGPSFYSETLNGASNAVKVLHYVECCMSNDGSGVSVDPFFAITFDLVPHFAGGRYHMHQWIWRQPASGVPGNLDTNAVIYLLPAWDFTLDPHGPEIFDLEVNLPPGKNMGQFMMYYESISI